MSTQTEKPSMGWLPYPDSQLWRMAFKSPILAWRLGLGRLLGQFFVLITVKGRKSGLPRRAVTEYLPWRGKVYVISGYGEHAQWYKNLLADPHATLQTWQGAEAVVATRVTDADELREVLRRFRSRDRVTVDWYLESLGLPVDDLDAALAEKAKLHVVRFDATDAPTLPPLEADLVWVWPVMAVGLLGAGLWLRRKGR